MRFGVALKRRGDGLFDLLRLEHLVIAQRDVVVLAHQQIEDIDVVIPRLRPIHKEPRTRPLAQGIVHVLGVVREHAKGAIAAHNGVGPRKALHQNSRDFQLPRRGLAIAALARKLVNVVDGAKADDDGSSTLLINALAFWPDLP